ncbi:hypothetical protein TNCV_4600321 [Trichonephila clavipes]|nr:hypothetical protein TNCV_4600321 [Trichonephila clavipes]
MPPDRQKPDQAPQNSPWQRAKYTNHPRAITDEPCHFESPSGVEDNTSALTLKTSTSYECECPRQIKLTSVISSITHTYTGGITIWLDSTPSLKKNTLDQEPPTSPSLPPTSREDLRIDGYLKYPHALEGPIHLQTSMIRTQTQRHSIQCR